jgi:uncharacterized NAD(P)/FAD-binding protein YdhS
MRQDSARVLIVGGGAVGVSIAHHVVEEALATRAARRLEIVLVERRAEVGPGVAYELDVDTHLLNTRAAGISAVYGDKPHFYRWLLANEELWRPAFPAVRPAPTAFLPRGLFGLYLRDVAAQTERRARAAGIGWTALNDDVTDVARGETGFVAQTAGGARIAADVVAICTGNTTLDPFPQFAGRPGYYDSPYPTGALLRSIGADDDVIVLGSRLSAIDAAIALLESERFRGRVKLVSRGGMLPSVRGAQEAHTLRHITRDRIRELGAERGGLGFEDIRELCLAEARASACSLEWDEVVRPGLDAYAWMLEEIFASAGRARPWQGLVYALNEVIDELWRVLREDERRRLNGALRSEFLTYRVSIPVENACKIARAMSQGRLSVHGGLERIEAGPDSGRFEARLRAPGANPVILTGTALINATGFDNGSALEQIPLLARMHGRGLLREHHHGGIDVDFDTGRALDAAGAPQRDLLAVGAVTSGVHFFTSALDVNVRHAARSARDIITTIADAPLIGDVAMRYSVLPEIGVEA